MRMADRRERAPCGAFYHNGQKRHYNVSTSRGGDMKHLSRIAAAVLALGAFPIDAVSQSYPARPIRMVIGFPPGGGTDIVGRIVAQRLSEVLGQSVLPDNRGGAAGLIATEIVAKAPPDGYTILMAHIAAISILPSLMPKIPYDAAKD